MKKIVQVCMFCQKMADGDEWIPQPPEIISSDKIIFSHGLCSDCLLEYYSEYLDSSLIGYTDQSGSRMLREDK